jgi:hypothetical protein
VLGEVILPSTYLGLGLILTGLWLQQRRVAAREASLAHG